MKHKTRSKAWARRYLKVMNRNILSAFDMGYEDGAAGTPRQAPPSRKKYSRGHLLTVLSFCANNV